jgi:hypothetical protein
VLRGHEIALSLAKGNERAPAGRGSLCRGQLPTPSRTAQSGLVLEFGSRLFPVRPTSARCQSVVRDKPRKAEDHKERADDDNSHPC